MRKRKETPNYIKGFAAATHDLKRFGSAHVRAFSILEHDPLDSFADGYCARAAYLLTHSA